MMDTQVKRDPTQRLEIRKAQPYELNDIYKFRYQVYVDELKIHQRFADHSEKTVAEPFDLSGHLYVAIDPSLKNSGQENSGIVGMLRVNLPRESSIAPFDELFHMKNFTPAYPEKVVMMSSCLVSESWRGSNLMFRLIDVSFTDMLSLGIEHVFFCCSKIYEPLYTRLGGRRYPEEIHHPDQGPAIVFRSDLLDLEQFKRTNSPVLHIIERHLTKTSRPLHAERSTDL